MKSLSGINNMQIIIELVIKYDFGGTLLHSVRPLSMVCSDANSFTIGEVFLNIFLNSNLNVAVFCWFFFCAYLSFILFLVLFLIVKLFLRDFSWFKPLTKIFFFRFFIIIFFIFFYEGFLYFIFFNCEFLPNLSQFLPLFSGAVLYFVFKLRKIFSYVLVRRLNLIFYLFFIFYFFFKDSGVYERYCSAPSYLCSFPAFFFTQFNTLSLMTLFLAYFMLVVIYGTAIKGLTPGIFFSRSIFLSIFFGILLDLVMLLLLNTVLAYDASAGRISGIVMLFQNTLRIDENNLILLIAVSCVALFF